MPGRYSPLFAQDLRRVIAGQGTSSCIPVLLCPWISQQSFETESARSFVQALLDAYPCDARIIYWKNIEMHQAPEDDPGYCWIKDGDTSHTVSQALDVQAPLSDWSRLDGFLADFPSADYPHLFPVNPPADGRYRIAHWWYTIFERHWSLCGMSNALMDYYTNPDEGVYTASPLPVP